MVGHHPAIITSSPKDNILITVQSYPDNSGLNMKMAAEVKTLLQLSKKSFIS